jgi:predicted HD phosphohydrolase
MDDAEITAFERGANMADLVTLRRADDAAKVIGLAVDGLDAWRPRIERLSRA